MVVGEVMGRLRCVGGVVVAVSLGAGAPTAVAARARPPTDDIVGFDLGFREGQHRFDAGEYLSSARTWARAARLLQEAPENRVNRAAVHEYIASAYRMAVVNGAGEDIIREGLDVLDEYAALATKRYPGEPLPAQVEETREEFRAMLDVTAAAREREMPPPKPVEPEPELSAPQLPPAAPARSRAWKPLVAVGAVSLGAGLGMLGIFVGGLARVRAVEQQYEDNSCRQSSLTDDCAQIARSGRSMDQIATIGVIAAPVLLAAGAAMLAVGLKRRPNRQAIAPVLGRGMVGLMVEGRF